MRPARPCSSLGILPLRCRTATLAFVAPAQPRPVAVKWSLQESSALSVATDGCPVHSLSVSILFSCCCTRLTPRSSESWNWTNISPLSSSCRSGHSWSSWSSCSPAWSAAIASGNNQMLMLPQTISRWPRCLLRHLSPIVPNYTRSRKLACEDCIAIAGTGVGQGGGLNRIPWRSVRFGFCLPFALLDGPSLVFA